MSVCKCVHLGKICTITVHREDYKSWLVMIYFKSVIIPSDQILPVCMNILTFFLYYNKCLCSSEQSVPIEWRNASNAKSQSPRKLDKVSRIIWFLLSGWCLATNICSQTNIRVYDALWMWWSILFVFCTCFIFITGDESCGQRHFGFSGLSFPF